MNSVAVKRTIARKDGAIGGLTFDIEGRTAFMEKRKPKFTGR